MFLFGHYKNVGQVMIILKLKQIIHNIYFILIHQKILQLIFVIHIMNLLIIILLLVKLNL